MVQTLRKPEIIQIARREGKVTVEGLVAHFNVTPQTIRRDLAELADSGQLERVHGGAILPSSTVNIAYNERRQLNQTSKTDIARRVAPLIPDDCSVFLNIGTTTEAVANELVHHSGLMLVTNNLNIAGIFSNHPSNELVLTGGTLRKSDGGLVGGFATETVERFRFDFAVIGCSALHPGGDILDFDIREVGVSRAIIERSDCVILATDLSKLGRKAPIKIASLAEVDMLATDVAPPEDYAALCREHGTEILVAGET
ncbi:DeoR/GlpR family DNA-binding transcription regulator [Jannaschia marina]|uniref:DeoR/GlpR family DNA-binding transcription regulator n=1 Tax=Jannaschia marina TaxID=2741674 RepID=UPI0015CAE308|nr:DeoR/GlpR family DNA-binding transcription regulator [Jannaschia marina]